MDFLRYFFLGPLNHPSFLPPAEAASFAPCLPTDYSHGTRIKEKRGGRRGLFFLPENGCMCCMSQGSFHIHFVYCVYMHKYAVEREEATVDLGRPEGGRIFLEGPPYNIAKEKEGKLKQEEERGNGKMADRARTVGQSRIDYCKGRRRDWWWWYIGHSLPISHLRFVCCVVYALDRVWQLAQCAKGKFPD